METPFRIRAAKRAERGPGVVGVGPALRRRWLLLPLALAFASIPPQPYGEPGYVLLLVYCMYGLSPALVLLSLANLGGFLAGAALLASRGQGRAGGVGRVLAWGSLACAISLGFVFPELRRHLAYWTWTASLATLALVATRLASRLLAGYVCAWTAPRAESFRVELWRVLLAASLPALCLGALAFSLVADRVLPVITTMELVPPEYAAAGSAVLIVALLALGWRILRPRPAELFLSWTERLVDSIRPAVGLEQERAAQVDGHDQHRRGQAQGKHDREQLLTAARDQEYGSQQQRGQDAGGRNGGQAKGEGIDLGAVLGEAASQPTEGGRVSPSRRSEPESEVRAR